MTNTTGSPDRGAKYDVWVALYRAVRAVTERVDKQLLDSGHIALADYEALHRIHSSADSRIRLVDLARTLLVSPSSATRITDRLEKRGLVERQPSLTDRRETFIVLTDAGNDLFWAAQPFLLEAVEAHFSALVPDESVEELKTILRSISAGSPATAVPAARRNGTS